MSVNREEYLILAAYVGALTHPGQGRIGDGTLLEPRHRGAVELSRSDEPGQRRRPSLS